MECVAETGRELLGLNSTIMDKSDQAGDALQKYQWVILAALCAAMWGQLFLSSRQLSVTADEATHLYAGYRYLKCGDVTVSPEHPPLAKEVAAAPLLLMNITVDCSPFKGNHVDQAIAANTWLFSQNWHAALAWARMAVFVFAVGLCLLVWITARRMFGLNTAILACLLLIFEPNMLAYGSLVMTDVPVTCMLLLAVFGFYLWSTYRTIPFLLLTASATGLTLLAKHSGVVVVPVLGALAITDGFTHADGDRWELALRNLLVLALICVLAATVVWAGYGLLFVGHRPELKEHSLLPKAYLEGFATALILSHQGSGGAFVAGKFYSQAPWFSTPLNFLIRNTTAFLVMIVVAPFGWAIAFRRGRREKMFMLVPIAAYVGVCVLTANNVSLRYLLPIFPFLMIAAASGCVELVKHMRCMKYGVLTLILLHAASSLHAYPNYLSYANDLWGGPAQAYKYEPWVDIGQAYPETKAYLERHPSQNCWLVTGWHWDPRLYDVPCQASGPYLLNEMPPHVRGTVLVSSTLLTDVRMTEGELAVAFKNATPKDHIGGSALLVYEGDFDTSLNAAVVERRESEDALSVGRLNAAMEHGERAVELAPTSALAHINLCKLLEPAQVDLAREECFTARNLLRHDPLRDELYRKYYLDSLERFPTVFGR